MLEVSDKTAAPCESEPRDAGEPTTLVEVYEAVLRDHPKPDSLNYKRDGVWQAVSAAEMLGRARHISLGLYSLGLRKGDRVAIVSESRVEWVLADQGCIMLGVITVPIYPTLSAAQVKYIITDSGARAIFISTTEKHAQLETTLRESATIAEVILFTAAADSDHGAFLTLAELEMRGREVEAKQPQLSHELAHAAKP